MRVKFFLKNAKYIANKNDMNKIKNYKIKLL